MHYPTPEYTYVDEYGQAVDPSSLTEHVYADSNNEQIHLDGHAFDQQQQIQGQYRSIASDGSQPLAKCSVLYLGTAISSPGQRGIDAIQEPLSRRYPVDGKEVVRGVEAWLAIYENGLQLQFARDPSVVIFYPIRSLVYCASIRFATRTQTGAEFPHGWRFVPLDSPAAARVENTRNPPLFAATFRRTRHLPADECFCFVAKTKQAALALVQACFSAYQATTPDQDCSKVPLYFRVDDYGSKDKEIDSEIRIVPVPDRDRTLDYQTNTEGFGFFYKTDRVLIDTWQLWEHHKHDTDRRSTSKHRFASPRSRSHSSSSSSHSSSTSCSSCRHNRRSRRRRLASIASIPAIQQQSNSFTPTSPSQSTSTNQGAMNSTTATSMPQPVQRTVDPYAPAPNLIRVERMKDVNSGQEVFIRWVSEANSSSNNISHDEQHRSNPQQAYSTQPPHNSQLHDQDEMNRNLPSEIERLALDDEYLRKSLLFDEGPPAGFSNHERKRRKKRSKREKKLDFDQPPIDYEVVTGFFEDRHGRKRPVKVDRSRRETTKDYRYLFNDTLNSFALESERQRHHHHHPASSFSRPPLPEPARYSTPLLPLPVQPLTRPFGPPFLPRGVPYYPPQSFSTTPLFSQPNFLNRPPLAQPPFWYRPM